MVAAKKMGTNLVISLGVCLDNDSVVKSLSLSDVSMMTTKFDLSVLLDITITSNTA